MYLRSIAVLIFVGQLTTAPVWSDESSVPKIYDPVEKLVKESNDAYRDTAIRNMQMHALSPWIASVQRQINTKFVGEEERRLENLLREHSEAVVYMVVKPSGELQEAGTGVSSGSNQTDRLALNAVRSVGSFLPPPNELPCGREGADTCVRFRSINQHLEVFVHADFPRKWLENSSLRHHEIEGLPLSELVF